MIITSVELPDQTKFSSSGLRTVPASFQFTEHVSPCVLFGHCATLSAGVRMAPASITRVVCEGSSSGELAKTWGFLSRTAPRPGPAQDQIARWIAAPSSVALSPTAPCSSTSQSAGASSSVFSAFRAPARACVRTSPDAGGSTVELGA